MSNSNRRRQKHIRPAVIPKQLGRGERQKRAQPLAPRFGQMRCDLGDPRRVTAFHPGPDFIRDCRHSRGQKLCQLFMRPGRAFG